MTSKPMIIGGMGENLTKQIDIKYYKIYKFMKQYKQKSVFGNWHADTAAPAGPAVVEASSVVRSPTSRASGVKMT